MPDAATILIASLLIAFVEFVLSATLIWRPRLLELRNDRDRWRTRAISAEDHADTQDIDIRVLTDWGSATEPLEATDE